LRVFDCRPAECPSNVEEDHGSHGVKTAIPATQEESALRRRMQVV